MFEKFCFDWKTSLKFNPLFIKFPLMMGLSRMSILVHPEYLKYHVFNFV